MPVCPSDDCFARIGRVAEYSGVSVKTIRYYESLGLLAAKSRTRGGFRLFDLDDALVKLAFIKRSQELGLSLHDIGKFLQVRDRGELPCAEIRTSLKQKVAEIDAKIEQLAALRAELKGLLSGWEDVSHPREGTICPILERASSAQTSKHLTSLKMGEGLS
ncbi:MAG: heavy metal-responsive transcriptional regulator [Cyanobacteria bacterium P01_E01_bin.48]